MAHKEHPDYRLEPNVAEAYQAQCRPDAPVHLGLIQNPAAGRAHRLLDRIQLSRLLPCKNDMATTRHEGEVSAAVRHLLLRRGVNVLAINGGDGTIHTVVNTVWNLLEEMEELWGERLPSPLFLFVSGGTMNMTSRAMGNHLGVSQTIRKFQRLYSDATFGQVALREVNTLSVNTPTSHKRGLIFGSELVHNAISAHRYFGDGYLGLARLLGHVSVGPGLNTTTWRNMSYLLNPPRSSASLNGMTYARYAAAVASTVDLMLVRGLVKALRAPANNDGFHVKMILETEKTRLVKMIPVLLKDGDDPRIMDVEAAHILKVKGSFTLDGELYPADAETPVTVSVDPRQILAVQFPV